MFEIRIRFVLTSKEKIKISRIYNTLNFLFFIEKGIWQGVSKTMERISKEDGNNRMWRSSNERK